MPEVGAVLQAVDREDLLVALERRLDRMALGDLAEAARERDLLVGGEVLVGEEQHEVLEPRGADRGDGLVGQRLGEVDAADLGADRRAHPLDVELRRDRHGSAA